MMEKGLSRETRARLAREALCAALFLRLTAITEHQQSPTTQTMRKIGAKKGAPHHRTRWRGCENNCLSARRR